MTLIAISRRIPTFALWLGATAALASTVLGHAVASDALFWGGAATLAAVLIALGRRTTSRPSHFGVAVVVLVVATLLAVEGFERQSAGRAPWHRAPPYSFRAWQRDPAGYQRWTEQGLAAFAELRRQIESPDPEHHLPWILAPGRQGTLLESHYQINSLGFRDREFARDKGGAYRIVVVGDSTVMGLTTEAGDRPWPELLEERIHKKLKPKRLVEVINAGVYGYDLHQTLTRVERDVLPLHPDMIIVHHGVGSLRLVDPALPSLLVPEAPTLRRRPSGLLARAELSLRRSRFRPPPAGPSPTVPPDLDRSEAAQLFRQLGDLCAGQGTILVLASTSLAVLPESPPDVVAFYARTSGQIPQLVATNRLHTRLLRDLAPELGARFVDTSPDLDGDYGDAFVDLAHVSPLGARRLADNVLAGIADLVRAALAGKAGPAPRPAGGPKRGHSADQR